MKAKFLIILFIGVLFGSNLNSQNKTSQNNISHNTEKITIGEKSKNPEYVDFAEYSELKNKKEIFVYVSILLFTIFIIMFFIAGMRFKKINNILREKNIEIEAQRSEIQKQKDKIIQKTMNLLVLNKELKENAELRGGLTNMIVHDLKNPISNIINISEKREITFFAKDMLTMVENILDIQKYEGMVIPLNKKDILLRKNADEAIKQVSIFAERKNIKIRNEINDDIFVSADEAILRRIFVNFLSNAVKYTFANGIIKVESRILNDKSDRIKVYVTDNGIGIKEESIPLIFNKFNQILARKTGEARSTGIGLTFCKMAVEAHESEIKVKSVPNEFTSFEFELQIAEIKKTQYGHDDIIEKVNVINLNVDDKTYLRQFYDDFNLLDVYEISELRTVQNIIDENFSENVKKWKNELNKAIYNCNSELYNALKESIN